MSPATLTTRIATHAQVGVAMAWSRPKASTTARGYGGDHAKARKAAAQQHKPSDPCPRCGHPLGPMGSWLHWDHNDQRTGYLGFSHGRRPCPWCGDKCNLKVGARKGQRIAHRTRTKAARPSTAARW